MASRQWNTGGFLRQPRRADDFPAPRPSFPARFRRARRERKRRGASVASPIICRSALAIEAHRGVASLANTARYGLRDAPCAGLRWPALPTPPNRGRATRRVGGWAWARGPMARAAYDI